MKEIMTIGISNKRLKENKTWIKKKFVAKVSQKRSKNIFEELRKEKKITRKIKKLILYVTNNAITIYSCI